MNTDYVYWTFSAAAQSIAAFVALLLAGYAFVHSLMEAARERDDTLDEIHSTLRTKYHSWLKALAWTTGGSIILSLLVVYLNHPYTAVSKLVLSLVAALDICAVVGGLVFVVSIVDPRKYQAAAKRVLEEERGTQAPAATPVSEFADAFIHLERLVRNRLKADDLYVPSRGAPRMSFSFRQMIEALRNNELIDAKFYNELDEINKYRNLVFHGHEAHVDSRMVRRARDASDRIESLPGNG